MAIILLKGGGGMNVANLLSANMITANSGLESIKGDEVASGDFTALLVDMMNTDAKAAMNSENIIMQILQMLSNGAESEECLNLLDGVDIEVLEEVANLIDSIVPTDEDTTIDGAESEDIADEKATDDDGIEDMQQLASVVMPIHIHDVASADVVESGSNHIYSANAVNSTIDVQSGEQLPQGINIAELANVVDGATFEEVSNLLHNAMSNATTQKMATETANHASGGAEFKMGDDIDADKAMLDEANIEITKMEQDKSAQILERSISELRPVVMKSEEIAQLQKAHRTTNADNVQPIDSMANPEMSAINEGEQAQVIIERPIEQVANEINNYITALEKEGSTKIEMKLEPESLGKVVIEMTLEGGKLAVKIVAENQIASAMLAERASDLTHGLKGQGITLESYDISYSNHDTDNSFSGRNPQFSRSKSTFTMHGDFSGEVDSDYANSPSSALNLYV